jgi:hypothetical protein
MADDEIEKVESWTSLILSSVAQAGLIFIFFLDFHTTHKPQPELLASVAAISLMRQVPEFILSLRIKK